MKPKISSLANPINEKYPKIYQQIENYSLNRPEEPCPFSNKLAKENG
jgi:hypothetical protein